MVNAAFVSDAQHRVAKTGCPSCGAPNLEFALRCDIGHAECLFLARCGRCHMAFDLDQDSLPFGLTADHLHAGQVLCPRCNQSLAVVSFACTTSSRSCGYSLQCTECGQP